jgi:hypothetical protein
MIDSEEKLGRRQVRCYVDDADWIEEEVVRREKVLGRRKVWPADVVRDAVSFLKSSETKPAASGGLYGPEVSPKNKVIVNEFLDFLRTGEKSDVHTVLSLIARLSARRGEMGESSPERKLHSR